MSFKTQELVPKHIYQKRGEKAIELINPLLIDSLNQLKQDFPSGSITVNNWLWGGSRNWSGLRTPGSPDYSETSQHSVGNGADCKFSEYDEADVRAYIIANPKKYPHVKGVEDFAGMTWVHLDCRNRHDVAVFTG